jgi:hypothetical protein
MVLTCGVASVILLARRRRTTTKLSNAMRRHRLRNPTRRVRETFLAKQMIGTVRSPGRRIYANHDRVRTPSVLAGYRWAGHLRYCWAEHLPGFPLRIKTVRGSYTNFSGPGISHDSTEHLWYIPQ